MKAKEITNEYFLAHVFDYQNNTDNWHFKGDRPAVIDFYATWCGPCKAMAPHLERIAEEYDGKIDVYKVDVDQESELSAVFNIRSVPTLLFIPMNDTPQMATGALSYGQLKEVVDTHLLTEAGARFLQPVARSLSVAVRRQRSTARALPTAVHIRIRSVDAPPLVYCRTA